MEFRENSTSIERAIPVNQQWLSCGDDQRSDFDSREYQRQKLRPFTHSLEKGSYTIHHRTILDHSLNVSLLSL